MFYYRKDSTDQQRSGSTQEMVMTIDILAFLVVLLGLITLGLAALTVYEFKKMRTEIEALRIMQVQFNKRLNQSEGFDFGSSVV